MAEVEPSASHTLDAVKLAVGDCRGTFGPTMIFLTKHKAGEIDSLIQSFADELVTALK